MIPFPCLHIPRQSSMASWETFIKSVALSPIKETLEKIVFTNGFSVKCLGDFSVIIWSHSHIG